MAARKRLGIGIIGSGFMTRFHIQSFVAVRDADILGIWSPTREHAESAARLAVDLGVGGFGAQRCRAFESLAQMVSAPQIDAIWIVGPNYMRVAHAQEIFARLAEGKAELKGVACEKPLARNVAEARQMLDLAQQSGIPHAYMENQLFAPSVVRGREILWRRGAAISGRPYLARTAEEHSGPHNPWFWDGARQGGGVLNDMLCHCVESGRWLLTDPQKPRHSVTLKHVSAQIAALKWTRPEYAKRLKSRMHGIDYAKTPAEDFARGVLTFQDEAGNELILEASTSWSYVGTGLRLTFEVLGPEYSMSVNSLDSDLKVYFSREVKGTAGEDIVEKQNAEQGLNPVVPTESAYYGYEGENRYVVGKFLAGEMPAETWAEGFEVVQELMACYMAAEQKRTVPFPPDGLDAFVPAVAKGEWAPGQ
ncbi:MAG: Gfo/Idh/MocA family oxidoreductase [Kiritimatiellae bacterium]|nr:Gfo/Idh/MocA family oxidoreductase [Kiritimatiellia bacterium]